MFTSILSNNDSSVTHNLPMFLHFMVNDVKIIEEQTMMEVVSKMFKFTKQFNLLDSVKNVPTSWNDHGLHNKYLEALTQKGKSDAHKNPDIIIFTRRKDTDHRGFNAALLGGGNSHIKRKQ